MSKCNKREKKENSGIVLFFWVPPITPSSFRELSLLGGGDDEIG
jgi:hypothetical protein